MLKFLSGRRRSRNAVLIIFIALLTLSLVALFSASGNGNKLLGGAVGSDTVIAKVGAYEVTARELRDALNNFGQQLAQGQGRTKKEDLGPLYEMYGQQVLDSLIRQKLIMYEADRLSLGSSDTEVQSRLMQMFAPWPGAEQYRLRLQQAGTTPVRFEDELRASLAQEHLRSYIAAAVSVDPKEVEDDYRRSNTTFSARWLEIDPQKLQDKIQVNEPDLRAYFESHKDDYKITSEQRKARYVFIDQEKAGESLQVPDEELKQDFTPDRFIKQVRVSEIVLNIPKEADDAKDKAAADKTAVSAEETIRNKAQGISQRAQGTGGNPAEDFAKLAKEFSEDPKTKAKGGDLGWIKKADKRDNDDPLNRVFNMQQDETSQPIKKGDSYYILKVTDRQVPTFADVRDELLKAARMRRGYTRGVDIANEAEQQMKETKNPVAVADAINKKYGTQVALVRDTPFFSEGEPLADLGGAQEFGSTVFQLQNTGDTGKQIPVDKGFAIGQYLERRDPHQPTFEEATAKVDKAYRIMKAKELASERANTLAKAQSLDELKKLGESMSLRLDERVGLSSTDSIGPVVSEASREKLYKLAVGQVIKEPIKTDSDVYVVGGLSARKDADMGAPFQKERRSIEQRLLDEKRNTFFSTYLAMTQKQLKEEGKIKIYDSAIQTAMALEGVDTTAPQLPPSTTRSRRGPGGQVFPGPSPVRR